MFVSLLTIWWMSTPVSKEGRTLRNSCNTYLGRNLETVADVHAHQAPWRQTDLGGGKPGTTWLVVRWTIAGDEFGVVPFGSWVSAC
jgi:hypothetical protein